MPLLHNNNGEGSKENIDYSNPNKIRDDDVRLKRRKVSALLGSNRALHNSNKLLRSALAPIAEDDGDNGTNSISIDSSLASIAKITLKLEDSPRIES